MPSCLSPRNRMSTTDPSIRVAPHPTTAATPASTVYSNNNNSFLNNHLTHNTHHNNHTHLASRTQVQPASLEARSGQDWTGSLVVGPAPSTAQTPVFATTRSHPILNPPLHLNNHNNFQQHRAIPLQLLQTASTLLPTPTLVPST